MYFSYLKEDILHEITPDIVSPVIVVEIDEWYRNQVKSNSKVEFIQSVLGWNVQHCKAESL